MDKKTIELLARLLWRRRDAFFNEFTHREKDLLSISENRESEIEELAQGEKYSRLLARLDDHSIREIEEINAALQRISDGTYGLCERCGEEIPLGRLRVLPATRFCLGCAKKAEGEPPQTVEEETPHPGKLPGDLGLFDDREVEVAIREWIREDGRIDPDELGISCRRGVVYLTGVLPSKAEHQILLKLLMDFGGLKDVVDHVQIEELLWEREDRSKKEPPEPDLPWNDTPGTEDILESVEEGKDYVPPSEPIPDEG